MIGRGGAKPGDWIYVSGALGGSILGRHLTFVPRLDLAIELAARHELQAMMDAAGFVRTSFRNMSGGIVAIHTGYRA